MQQLETNAPIPSLELRRITKRFGEVAANQSVDFSVYPGEIHALVGENGAGKSTLMRIAAGIHQQDEGEILIEGTPRKFADARDAMKSGIGMVHQHFSLVPSMTVAENLFLSAPPNTYGLLRPKELNQQVSRLSDQYRLDLPLDGAVGEQPVGVQQRLEILKALLTGKRVLILDEPTAVLTPQEADRLLETLRELKTAGHTIILITHKLREVFAIADRITVMRDGRHFPPVVTRNTTPGEITQKMVGREILLRREVRPTDIHQSEVLTLQEVRCPSDHGHEALKGVCLTLNSGEIVGIAGVDGNGQDELAEIIAGLRGLTSGRLEFFGNEVRNVQSPRQRRRLGIAHIPADRMLRGVAAGASVAENLALGAHELPPIARGLWLRRKQMHARAERLISEYRIRTASEAADVSSLSGGNIQKVVVARELSGDVKILLAVNPTRGVDVGAAEFIHQQLLRARSAGVGVLLISSELDEIRLLSDRIVVIENGRLHGPFEPSTSEYILGLYMSGGIATEANVANAAVIAGSSAT